MAAGGYVQDFGDRAQVQVRVLQGGLVTGGRYYIEMAGQPGVPRSTVQAELDKMTPAILEALIQPEKNGLQAP